MGADFRGVLGVDRSDTFARFGSAEHATGWLFDGVGDPPDGSGDNFELIWPASRLQVSSIEREDAASPTALLGLTGVDQRETSPSVLLGLCICVDPCLRSACRTGRWHFTSLAPSFDDRLSITSSDAFDCAKTPPFLLGTVGSGRAAYASEEHRRSSHQPPFRHCHGIPRNSIRYSQVLPTLTLSAAQRRCRSR